MISNYIANQGNHTSFKIIFHCSSSRGFCVKGVYLNKACHVQWKQLLSYFPTSPQKWMRHVPKLLLKRLSHHHSLDGVETQQLLWLPGSLHLPITGRWFALPGLKNKLLNFSEGTLRSLLNQDRLNTLTNNPAEFATNSGLQFPPVRPQAQFRRLFLL